MHQNWNSLAYLSQSPVFQNVYNPATEYQESGPSVVNLQSQPNIQNVPNTQSLPNIQSMPIFQRDPKSQGDIGQPPLTPQQQEVYSYPQNLAPALKLIEEAVAGENEDRLFYQYLINQAPTEEEKEIIRGIRENEITHFGLFRQIYSQLTGRMLPVPEDKPAEMPESYCEGLKKALIGEERAAEKYRRILFAMQNRVHINMLTEIITDELRHGTLYSYLYARNQCKA